MEFIHESVLLEESIDGLIIKEDGIYVDCTLGGAGHSSRILERFPKVRIIGIDQDMSAIKAGSDRLSPYGDRAKVVWSNFSNLSNVLDELGYDKVDGFLMDLGVSSPQLDNGERGFSYQYDGPLDMRMNQDAKLSAYDIVNNMPVQDLIDIIYSYGEESWAKRIGEFIGEARKQQPIETTFELVTIIKKAIPKKVRETGGHPAKKTFQAIRIAVNDELNIIGPTIDMAVSRLNLKGRIAIITFHSLEDRIVKEKFQYLAKECICPPHQPICTCNKVKEVKIVTRKPIVANVDELDDNRRARSAKLRIAEKI